MTSVDIEDCTFFTSDMEVATAFSSVPREDINLSSTLQNSSQKDQWNLHSTKIRECWAKWGVKGAGARVAVIDSGVRNTHKDLTTCLKGSYDYTHDKSPMNEGTDHGTHVCGIIGAADNGDLVTGVAPECEIHSFKIFGRGNSCKNENIIRALRDIKNKKYGDFDIINMSIGCPVPDQTIRMELQELCAQGVICVAASGNSGDHSKSNAPRFGTTDFPAAYDSTLCVGSTRSGGSRSSFTSTGPCLHILAPGENILSTWDTEDTAFASCSGTSMATPFVSGVIALLVSYCKKNRLPRPGLNQAIFCLAASATDMESSGFDSFTGFGLIDPSGTIDQYRKLVARSPLLRR
jgi:subtilisin family serine protease